jgi:L-fuculose-phosphate aldolase
MKEKKLLDGYVGVKFHAICEGLQRDREVDALFEDFRAQASRLKERDMTPENGGNVSVRFREGFVITASGCNLGLMEQNELVYVSRCEVEKEQVYYYGPLKPSSESLMHHLIYRGHGEAGAVVHAHDPLTGTTHILQGEVEETLREEPYGTLRLAELAIDTFAGGHSVILLKNHGYIAYGRTLTEAFDSVVDLHDRLSARRGGSALLHPGFPGSQDRGR